MKKFTILALILSICLCICACSKSSEQSSEDDHSHSYGKWKTVKAATCTEDGKEERECDCGETKSRTIEKTDHTWTEATCSAPKTCSQCNITEGSPLEHERDSATNKCKHCGAFEYTVEFAAKGATKMIIDEYNLYTESYEIHNIYYVEIDKCVCSYCANGIDIGEPYVAVIVFSEITYQGATSEDPSIIFVHKQYDPEDDTYHKAAVYAEAFYYYSNGTTLSELYATDYSFYFGESDLKLLSKSDVLG